MQKIDVDAFYAKANIDSECKLIILVAWRTCVMALNINPSSRWLFYAISLLLHALDTLSISADGAFSNPQKPIQPKSRDNFSFQFYHRENSKIDHLFKLKKEQKLAPMGILI